MKFKYYIKSHGEGPEDAIELESKYGSILSEINLRWMAEEAAEHEFDHCDGWEWMGDGVECLAIIVEGVEYEFKIGAEATLLFTASRKE